ncbi:MAG: hypothetical protein MRY74_14495 [Neomegalonema sp.]|nr:hypothetical protein [Neomegalonema sp.]
MSRQLQEQVDEMARRLDGLEAQLLAGPAMRRKPPIDMPSGQWLTTDQMTTWFSRSWLERAAVKGAGPRFSQSKPNAPRFYLSDDVNDWLKENRASASHEVAARERTKAAKRQKAMN